MKTKEEKDPFEVLEGRLGTYRDTKYLLETQIIPDVELDILRLVKRTIRDAISTYNLKKLKFIKPVQLAPGLAIYANVISGSKFPLGTLYELKQIYTAVMEENFYKEYIDG